MTRDRWESILFAHVKDEVVQDMLNMYVLELEDENAKLRQMVWVMRDCLADECKRCSEYGFPCEIDHDMQELGIGICDLAADGELGIEVDK